MAQAKEQIRVASKGQVYVAPVGTTLPTTVDTTLDSAFVGLGYTTEEGVTFTYEQTTEDIRAWQRKGTLRTIVTSRSLQIAFDGMQWNADTVALAFGGGEWTEVSPGNYQYDPPAVEDELAEYALVLDYSDGDDKYRLVIDRGSVTENVETKLVNNAAATLPITFKAHEPDDDSDRAWRMLSNDLNFATGS